MFGWLKKIIRGDSGLKNPEDWLRDVITGGDTASGVPVNSQTAITLSWVYAGINKISGDISRLPLHLYEKTDGGKERAKEHPAYYLMRRKPNDELTANNWIRASLYNALLHGNHYSYIVRDSSFRPVEIIPLDTTKTAPVRENGQLWYVTKVGTETRKLSPLNVLHIRGLSSDGIMGIPLLDHARETVGLGLAAERYASSFFGSNATPTGVLQYPTRLDDEIIKQIRKQWDSLHKGLDKKNIAVLQKGVEFQPISVSNQDSQFVENRKFSRQDIAAILNIPPHMVGDSTRTAFASLEAENASYLSSTLEPWLMTIESECWDKLLTEKEKYSDDWFFEFLRAALLKPDTASRYKIYATGIQNGILSPNEARDIEGLNSREGGDEFLTPKNMDSTDEKPEEKDEDEKKDEGTPPGFQAHKLLLTNALEKLSRWESSALVRASKKPQSFLATTEKFYDDHKARMVKDLEPVLACCTEISGASFDLEGAVDSYCSSTWDAVLEVAGCPADELETAVAEFVNSDSKLLALTFEEK